jgi:hypothetical protein
MMRNGIEAPVLLRSGCWTTGACLREVRVRPAAEDDEGLVDDLSAALLPLQRYTRLLVHCVLGLAEDDIDRLSVGDRETLLLHVRRLTFGDRMDCVLLCPGCGERMDFQLQIQSLLARTDASQSAHYFEETVEAAGEPLRVRFRVPCGADLEDVLRAPGRAVGDAVNAILARCVEWVQHSDAVRTAIPMDQWPAGLAARISERMSELDPQAETTLRLICPACQHAFAAFFDIGDYFFRELKSREHRRYREVHQLALAYHWSEADILSMSPRKRQLYLDLISESSGD